MSSENPLLALIRDTRLEVHNRSITEIAELMRPQMQKYGVCLISGFPTETERYLELLEQFGEPLTNYSSLSDLDKDDPSTKINMVRYKRKKSDGPKSVHYIDGELKPHSARSWRLQRPRYFAMLMVDPGWRDMEAGLRGESVILSWQYMFEQLAQLDSEVFETHFARLSSTPLRFEANNVKEDCSSSPLCYPLPDAASRFDVGVRLKQDLQEKLPGLQAQFEDYEAYRASIDYLVAATVRPEFQARFPLNKSDLILIDNNRFAHGRCPITGEREVDGRAINNPRELWSVCVA